MPSDRSSERLKTLIDKTSDGICLNDASGTTLFVNAAIKRILGFEPEELISKPGAIRVHPDDLEAGRVGFKELQATPGASRVMVLRNQHKDGSWRWIETTITNLVDDPSVGGFVSVFRDVTAQRTAKESLKRSEASLRAVIDHLPIGLLVHRDQRIIYANRAFATLLGYESGSDVTKLSVFDITPPERHERVRGRVAQRSLTVSAYDPPVEGVMLRRDGTRVVVELEALGVDFNGEPAALLIARDLSAHRDMIARMAVADRMRSVGMLAAGVAHEVNNPLAYVLSNLALVEQGLLSNTGPSRLSTADLTQLLGDARKGAERVRSVVRDLKALSRAEDELGAIALHDVLTSSINMARNEMRFRARLVQRLESTPLVRGSASRLGQVFLNVLVNACHAIAPGHVDENEIRVHTRALDAERVVVEITDTGCGISPENVGRIFDPFFTTKPSGIGTGLGLAICHGLLQSMGGTITVESKLDIGTTFTIALSVDEAPVPIAVNRPPADTAARRGRVLVIDDEPGMCVTLRLLLSQEHEIVSFTRARDALSCLETGEQFDVILCDLMMPEMSGMALHAAIAKAWPLLAPRIIFLTGGAFTADAREFLAQTSNEHLEKPFDEGPLFRAIRRIVG